MKIKITLLIITFLFSLVSCNTEKKTDEKKLEDYHTEFKKYANDYLFGLKTVLKRNMETGGILKSVMVCADTATDLTNMFSEAIELDVKRVSFKNRNPNNIPDTVEAKILHEYELLLKNNKLTKETETFGKFELDGKKIIRYMKPILVKKKCLKCHGNSKTIPKEVRTILKMKYPDDKAINYSVGELRGAVSITKEL